MQVVILDFPDVADSRALEKLYSVSSCRCFIQGFPRFCVGSYCYPRFPNDTPEFMKFINMGVFPKKVIITFFQWYPPTDILFDTKFWHYISQYAQCGIWRSIKSRIFHLGRVNVPAVPAISSVWTARCQGCWPTGYVAFGPSSTGANFSGDCFSRAFWGVQSWVGLIMFDIILKSDRKGLVRSTWKM